MADRTRRERNAEKGTEPAVPFVPPPGSVALPNWMYGANGYRLVIAKDKALDFAPSLAKSWPHGLPNAIYVSASNTFPPEVITALAAAAAKF